MVNLVPFRLPEQEGCCIAPDRFTKTTSRKGSSLKQNPPLILTVQEMLDSTYQTMEGSRNRYLCYREWYYRGPSV